MTEAENQMITLLEEIRDNLVKQAQRETERTDRFVQTNQELTGAIAKQYDDSQRTYREFLCEKTKVNEDSHRTYRENLAKLDAPKVLGLILFAIIALCLLADLVLRYVGR